MLIVVALGGDGRGLARMALILVGARGLLSGVFEAIVSIVV